MKTIKLPYYNVSQENLNLILEYQRQFSCILRFAYNRLLEGFTKTETEKLCKSLNNTSLMDSWLIRSAVYESDSIIKRNGKEKVVFGGKLNLYQFLKNKITKDQFKQKRLSNLIVQGESNQKGNRKFELDLTENQIIFKPKCGTKIVLKLPKLRKNYLKELIQLEIESQQKRLPIYIQLNSEFIWLSFDEKLLSTVPEMRFCPNRVLGIDLNPKEIGISVLEFDSENNYKILAKECFDFGTLTVKSGESSDSKKSKYLQNKLRFETLEMSKRIVNISKSWNCKFIMIEDLKFKSSCENKSINRLNKNKWLRSLFTTNLKKRCGLNGISLFEVNPAYSSLIGNLQHDCFDPVNASMEIGRRGFEVIILKNKKFYPSLDIKAPILHLWKETEMEFLDDVLNWKELAKHIKNLKFKYRVPLDGLKFNVFSLNSIKSNVLLYNFY